MRPGSPCQPAHSKGPQVYKPHPSPGNFVLSHILCRPLAPDRGTDNLLTRPALGLFRTRQMLNVWRRCFMTSTDAKRRQMTFLDGGWRIHLFMRVL
jgi:hypothetical protein